MPRCSYDFLMFGIPTLRGGAQVDLIFCIKSALAMLVQLAMVGAAKRYAPSVGRAQAGPSAGAQADVVGMD
jgi:hypothetical protein